MKLLLLSLAIIFFSAHSAAGEITYARHSVLADGNWIKIAVDSTGIQRIPYETLRAAGIVNPENAGVWGYSAARLNPTARLDNMLPDDLPQIPVWHHDRSIYFYGESARVIKPDSGHGRIIDESHYSPCSYYFITDSRIPRMIETEPSSGAACRDTCSTHIALTHIERDLINPIRQGTRYYYKKLTSDSDMRCVLALHNPIPRSKATLHWGWGASGASTLTVMEPERSTHITGTCESSIANPATGQCWRHADITTDLLFSDNPPNILTYDFALKAGSSHDASFDYTTIIYESLNRIGAGEMHMMAFENISDNTCITLSHESDVAVWDISDPTGPVSITLAEQEFAARRHAGMSYYIAFDPAGACINPRIIGNVPSQSIHTGVMSSSPEMLIVAAPLLMQAAEELATLHRTYQQMDVDVVCSDNIYNEFSSGAVTPMAIRRLVRMYHDMHPGVLRYVLLYGAATVDPVRGHSDPAILPMMQCSDPSYITSEIQCYATDTYMTQTDNMYSGREIHFSLPEMAVGRIPAGTPAEGHAYNAKIERMFTMPERNRTSYHTAFISDAGDNDLHHKNSEELAATYSKLSGTTVSKLYYDLYSELNDMKADLGNHRSDGLGYIIYSGHGDPGFICRDLWKIADASCDITDYPPFSIFLTCNAGRLDSGEPCIATTDLLSPHGGSLCVIASARLSVAASNHNLGMALTEYISEASHGDRIGDIWLKAMRGQITRATPYNTRNAQNILNFNLLGDPALPLPLPRRKIELNLDYPVAESGAAILSGDVGIPTFRGTADIRVYLDGTTRLTRGASGTKGIQVESNSIPVWHAVSDIIDGHFSLPVTLPATIATHGAKAHIEAYAIDFESETDAVGFITGVSLTDLTNSPSSTSPAIEITRFRVDGDGNAATSAGTLTAYVAGGENALCLSPANLELAPHLDIDGKRINSQNITITPLHNGKYLISKSLSEFEAGPHRATITLHDNMGNTAVATTEFTILPTQPYISIRCLEQPARTSAIFEWQCDIPEIKTARLIVTDIRGNTLHSADAPTGTAEWDLRDKNGHIVPPGPYRAEIIISGADRIYGASPRTIFNVLP